MSVLYTKEKNELSLFNGAYPDLVIIYVRQKLKTKYVRGSAFLNTGTLEFKNNDYDNNDKLFIHFI